MQTLHEGLDPLVRQCVKATASPSVRLWSFEVKRQISFANLRKSFFQAVSNSSWAHEGYLVTTSIANHKVEEELRLLSALHGIGVIVLHVDNPSESDIFLPSRQRTSVDWQMVDRIVQENEDFRDYIELVSTYFQTGRVPSREWNR